MTTQYKEIIVAVDGSRESDLAFEKSIAIADRNDSTLHLVNVINTRSFVAVEAYDDSISDRAKAFVLELLEEYKQKALKAGIKQVNLIIEFGSPKTMIPRDISKKVKADLIVCGATGLNSVERFLIGSVSENIVRSATCDVLVVRELE